MITALGQQSRPRGRPTTSNNTIRAQHPVPLSTANIVFSQRISDLTPLTGTSLHLHPAKRNRFSRRKRQRPRRDDRAPLLAPSRRPIGRLEGNVHTPLRASVSSTQISHSQVWRPGDLDGPLCTAVTFRLLNLSCFWSRAASPGRDLDPFLCPHPLRTLVGSETK